MKESTVWGGLLWYGVEQPFHEKNEKAFHVFGNAVVAKYHIKVHLNKLRTDFSVH